MSLRLRVLLSMLVLCGQTAATAAPAAALRIAAAADLASCMPRLNTGFDGETSFTTGASGNFYAQIRNGAPFDVFLSADTGYPRALADAGVADASSLYVYALGRLVLWSADPAVKTDAGLRMLTNPAIRRIAIANPDVAPYGRAAKAALERAGLWEALQGKLVYGENITQTLQFIESGNAQAGLISNAHLGGKHPGWALPADSYPVIEQGAIITSRGRAHPDAGRYLQYLRSPRARTLLAECGFTLPPGRE